MFAKVFGRFSLVHLLQTGARQLCLSYGIRNVNAIFWAEVMDTRTLRCLRWETVGCCSERLNRWKWRSQADGLLKYEMSALYLESQEQIMSFQYLNSCEFECDATTNARDHHEFTSTKWAVLTIRRRGVFESWSSCGRDRAWRTELSSPQRV